ncbi:MAG TPA: CDP-alcohol phosphatidyltransferase family protein [Anaerolineales bacterium]|nr:CDP-alcohol phosphatidyltransferase family protein [Anaerolineales bacterium]
MENSTQEFIKASFSRTFTDNMRLWFKGIVEPIARFLNRLGITPNTMTMLGLIGNSIGAYFLAIGDMRLGSIFILICTPFDALDGTMARLRGEVSEFGAFVDSVTDRYSELIVLGGLLVYFSTLQDQSLVILTYIAAVGSVMVSYVKARAESLKLNANTGILTRMERYLVLAPLLFFNQPEIAIWILAILANITALQRIYRVRRTIKSKV